MSMLTSSPNRGFTTVALRSQDHIAPQRCPEQLSIFIEPETREIPRCERSFATPPGPTKQCSIPWVYVHAWRSLLRHCHDLSSPFNGWPVGIRKFAASDLNQLPKGSTKPLPACGTGSVTTEDPVCRLLSSKLLRAQVVVFSIEVLSICMVAFGAAADRSVQTPTSCWSWSTAQHRRQTEEDRLIGIPRQQAIHQPPTATHQLTGQPHKGVHESFEFDLQHPGLVLAVFRAPTTRRFRQRQRPPGFQVPCQRRHDHVGPIAQQIVHRRRQRPHAAVQLRQQVLLVAAVTQATAAYSSNTSDRRPVRSPSASREDTGTAAGTGSRAARHR